MKKALLTVVVLAFVLSPLHNFGMSPNQAAAATISSTTYGSCIGTRCTSSCPFISCSSSTSCIRGCCGSSCLSSSAKISLPGRILSFFKSTQVKH